MNTFLTLFSLCVLIVAACIIFDFNPFKKKKDKNGK